MREWDASRFIHSMSEISPILPCSRSGGPSAAASHAADIDQPSQAQNGSRVELNESAQQLPEEVEVADPLSLLRGFAKVALAMEGSYEGGPVSATISISGCGYHLSL